MQPISIELNSPINTRDDGLLAEEPAFEQKNTLVYKGVASNITTNTGNGVLSTTGKHLYIEGNTIHAGDQSFTVPNNTYTVNNSTSREINVKEVAIDNTVAGVTSTYAYVDTDGTVTEIPFTNSSIDKSAQVWIGTVYKKPHFVAWKEVSDDNELIIFDKAGTVINRVTLNSIKFANNEITNLGKTISAAWVEKNNTNLATDYYVIGFDDEDVRRRAMFFVKGTDVMMIRGIGCVGNNYKAFGEPVPVMKQIYEPATSGLTSINTTRTWFVGSTTSVSSVFKNFQGFLPDVYEHSRYYKVLPNGVISAWIGPAYESYKLHSISSNTILEQVANENAGLGVSLTTTGGTQSGIGNWHWKIHNPLVFTNGSVNQVTGRTYPYTGTYPASIVTVNWETYDSDEDEWVSHTGSVNMYQTATYNITSGNSASFQLRLATGANNPYIVQADGSYIQITVAQAEANSATFNNAFYTGCPWGVYDSDEDTWSYRSNCRNASITINNNNKTGTYTGIPYLVQEDNEGASYNNTVWNSQSDGGRYLYTPRWHDSELNPNGYGTVVSNIKNRFDWGYAYNFWNGSMIYFGMSGGEDDFIFQDNWDNLSGSHGVNILGDWTYNYDSMKSYSNLTDYDGVFPCLRIFFNNATARGKYWEYDNTHMKCYLSTYFFSYGANELLFARYLQNILCEDNTTVFGSNEYIYPPNTTSSRTVASVIESAAKTTSYPTYNSTDALGNAYCIRKDWSGVSANTPYKGIINRFNCDNVKLSKSIDQNKQHVPYDGWAYYSQDPAAESSSGCFIHPLFIKGDGQGIQEESFSIGGLNDNSILSSLNTSTVVEGASLGTDSLLDTSAGGEIYQAAGIHATPVKYDTDYDTITHSGNRDYVYQTSQLTCVNYSGLQIGLSMLGTLIFNAEDMDNKYHAYDEIDNQGNTIKHLTIYNGKKCQSCTIQKNGTIKIDKLTDYMYRVNVLGTENLLIESRQGSFSFNESFKSYLQESFLNNLSNDLLYGTNGATSNAVYYYATGINSDLNDEEVSPSFLVPALTFNTYVNATNIDSYNERVIANRNPIIRQVLRRANITEGVDVYYASSTDVTDCTYKETDKLPANYKSSTLQEAYTGVQSFNNDLQDTSYWVDGDTVIYPVAISSEVSGVNYQTSTIDLPNNYAVRFYSKSNHTYNVYMQAAKVWYGQNIFTIMGSNYYFDGQGVYYIGSSDTSAADNTLVAYAVGMKYLCNAPSEAYFYSPFDRCLYIFTASNTMQKSTSLERFGDIIDSCYCPVNQSLYLLFDGKLLVKSQDDMALFDVEGNRLYTTADGVQVATDTTYTIHHPYKYEDYEDLIIETEWLGNPRTLSTYSFAYAVFYSETPINCDVEYDYLTIQDAQVEHHKDTIHIKKSDWHNNMCRVKLNPNDAVGNAFKIYIKSKARIGLYSLINYMEQNTGVNGVSQTR